MHLQHSPRALRRAGTVSPEPAQQASAGEVCPPASLHRCRPARGRPAPPRPTLSLVDSATLAASETPLRLASIRGSCQGGEEGEGRNHHSMHACRRCKRSSLHAALRCAPLAVALPRGPGPALPSGPRPRHRFPLPACMAPTVQSTPRGCRCFSMSHWVMAWSQSSPPRSGSPPVESTSITPPPTCAQHSVHSMCTLQRSAASAAGGLGGSRWLCVVLGGQQLPRHPLLGALTAAPSTIPPPLFPLASPISQNGKNSEFRYKTGSTATAHLQQADIVGPAPQVQNQHSLVLLGIQAIGERSSHRLPAGRCGARQGGAGRGG